jgi:hypothetical protein
MALTLCSDLSPADWLVASSLPSDRLVTFGPAGFEAYARLRFLPDPAYQGQSENDAYSDDNPPAAGVLRTLLRLLAAHTTTPDDCYCCLWEGWGDLYGRNAPPDLGAVIRTKEPADETQPAGWAPAPTPPAPPEMAKVVVPTRAYYLFQGRLAEAGDWGAANPWPSPDRLHMPEPAFVWPADHAWCIANDVDPHWAGIGADKLVIDQLVADPRLDVVRANPDDPQPSYR